MDGLRGRYIRRLTAVIIHHIPAFWKVALSVFSGKFAKVLGIFFVWCIYIYAWIIYKILFWFWVKACLDFHILFSLFMFSSFQFLLLCNLNSTRFFWKCSWDLVFVFYHSIFNTVYFLEFVIHNFICYIFVEPFFFSSLPKFQQIQIPIVLQIKLKKKLEMGNTQVIPLMKLLQWYAAQYRCMESR